MCGSNSLFDRRPTNGTSATRSFLLTEAKKKYPKMNNHHPFHFHTAAFHGGVETVPCSTDQHTLETLPPENTC